MWTENFQMFKQRNCQHLLDHRETKRVPEKHLLLLYWLPKPLTVCHNKLWKILKEMGIPDHLLRNLCAGQEATVRTGHEIMDWFQIGKGAHQGCILSPCLFNLYAEWKWKESEVAQSCLTLCDPIDCSLSGSLVHGIFQARVLESVAISFSRESSQPRGLTWVSHIAADVLPSEPPGTLWNARLNEAQAGNRFAQDRREKYQ